MRYESIRGELSFPALQDHSQNCFGILETGAEWAIRAMEAAITEADAFLKTLDQEQGS
jgi:hypothetical protein